MQLLTCWVGPISTPNPALILAATTPIVPNQLIVNTPVFLGGTRRVYITFTVAEPLTSYLILTGKGWGGETSEVIFAPAVGPVVISQFDYSEITSVRVGNTAFTGPITIGTGQEASSRWLRFDDFMEIFYAGQYNVFGTVNYTIETTMDDPTQKSPLGLPAEHLPIWFPSQNINLVGATTSQQDSFGPIMFSFIRVTLNSSGNTPSDYVEAKITQHSSVPGLF